MFLFSFVVSLLLSVGLIAVSLSSDDLVSSAKVAVWCILLIALIYCDWGFLVCPRMAVIAVVHARCMAARTWFGGDVERSLAFILPCHAFLCWEIALRWWPLLSCCIVISDDNVMTNAFEFDAFLADFMPALSLLVDSLPALFLAFQVNLTCAEKILAGMFSMWWDLPSSV